MKIKTILCALCAATTLGSCSYDDGGIWDAVNNQEERISALEKWQKSVVEQLNSLQGILTANDYVTNVENVEKDGAQGYKISFLHASPVTLYYNENSEVSGSGDSSIGVAQDDGGYYWTMNGEPLQVDGKKVYVTGGGSASLTPNQDNPEIFDLTVGGTTVTVNQEAVGTHPIKSVVEENGLVTITLNDNTTKILPKYVDLKAYLSSEYTDVANANALYPIALPEGCIIRKLDETPVDWAIAVTGTGATTSLKVTYPASGEVTVAFVISDGNALTVIQEATFKVGTTPVITWTTVAYNGSTITIPNDAKNIKVTGDASGLAPAAFASNITNPLKSAISVVNIDLSEVKYSKAFPSNAFYINTPLVPDTDKNTSIETVILPNEIINIWSSAFKNCKALKSVTVGTATEIPAQYSAAWFEGCDVLEAIYVPADKVEAYKNSWDSNLTTKIKAIPANIAN